MLAKEVSAEKAKTQYDEKTLFPSYKMGEYTLFFKNLQVFEWIISPTWWK